MQSLIDASVDETPSSGAKNIQVEIGQLDHEAMFLKMPVSETAASQKNVRGANMRDDSATRVIKELGADGNNFDREKAKHIQVEIGQLDHEAMFLKMPVSQTAGSQTDDCGAVLRDNSATQVVEELGAEDNNFDREKARNAIPVSQSAGSQKNDCVVVNLSENSATRAIGELGADGNNFDREKARNATPIFFDADSLEEFCSGTMENLYWENVAGTMENLYSEKLEEDPGLGRRKSSFRKAFVMSEVVADMKMFCMKSQEKDPLWCPDPLDPRQNAFMM